MSKIYVNRSGGSFWGIVLILVGLGVLADNLHWVSFNVWEVFWPAIIIAFGINLLFRRSRRIELHAEIGGGATVPPPRPPSSPIGSTRGFVNADRINESHFMGEVDLYVDSKEFRGGTASTVFGELSVDCSHAELADGEHVMALNTVFGTVRVVVPAGWQYSIEATTVFGEVDAVGTRRGGVFSNVVAQTDGYATATRRLRLHASTVFGEVRVVAH